METLNKMERCMARGTREWVRYFFLAVLAWVIVDFTTTAAIGNPRDYYSKYMPALLFFYLGYPLVFGTLRYRFRLGARGMFLAMIAGIVFVEIVCTHNILLYTLPVCLVAIPISLGHYGMVTFMPLWIAEGTVGRNRKWATGTVAVWAVGVLLNILTQFGGQH
jgi:hypothetical protein